MKSWTTPWGDLALARFPYDDDPTLQAWNGTDAALVEDLERSKLPAGSLVIVYNDAFGAVTCALLRGGYKVAQVSDSALSQRSTLWNAEANGLDDENLYLLDSLSVPTGEHVLFRLPQNLDLLEFQLGQIAGFLPQGSRLTAAAATKDVHTEALGFFRSFLGATTVAETDETSLIHAVCERRQPRSSRFPIRWKLDSLGVELVYHAGGAAPGKLDGGTKLLLSHFPHRKNLGGLVVDLGCGNGLFGLAAARLASEAEVYCVDESFLSIWSARETFRANELGGRGRFLCGDGLEDFDKESVDLIFCNPPFHFQNSRTHSVAYKMFNDAVKTLKPGGELWVVANRRLGHHKALAERFSRLSTAAVDGEYVVLRAVKGSRP